MVLGLGFGFASRISTYMKEETVPYQKLCLHIYYAYQWKNPGLRQSKYQGQCTIFYIWVINDHCMFPTSQCNTYMSQAGHRDGGATVYVAGA